MSGRIWPSMTTGERERRDRIIRRMTLAGATLAKCATEVGMSISGVRDARRRLGIQGPPRNPLTQDMVQRACAMVDDGCPFAEIARTLGIGEATLRRHFPGRSWNTGQVNDLNRALRAYNRSGDFKKYLARKELDR